MKVERTVCEQQCVMSDLQPWQWDHPLMREIYQRGTNIQQCKQREEQCVMPLQP